MPKIITSNATSSGSDLTYHTHPNKDVLDTITLSQMTTYIHNQLSASATWVISHNLKKFPSVTIVDSAGSVVIGDIIYNTENQITVTFTSEFSGKAYLN